MKCLIYDSGTEEFWCIEAVWPNGVRIDTGFTFGSKEVAEEMADIMRGWTVTK